MQIIDSILELAKTIEPAREADTEQEFHLVYKNKEWYAKVEMRLYYTDAKGATADEALMNLQKELINFNQSVIARITQKLKRWVNPNANLKVVK